MKWFLLVSSKPVCNQVMPVRIPFSFLQLLLSTIIVFSLTLNLSAQAPNTPDPKVLRERAAKIVATLSIADSNKQNEITSQLANQYMLLNKVHDDTKAAVEAEKKKEQAKEITTAALTKLEADKNAQLEVLHNNFIAQLKSSLTDEQIEKVKDGMTYRILPVTWAAYLDMLPKLTQEQKDQMYAWLVEAREKAMDQGSSDQKHAVFGKYKGRINNYLSAAGYDMKKEGEEWQKRIKAREAAKKQNQ